MEMTSYFIRRFLLIIPTFVGITLLVFAVTRLVPGGPIERALNEALLAGTDGGAALAAPGTIGPTGLSEAQLEQLRVYYGFDKPVLISYFDWLRQVLVLDLGTSTRYNEPVWDTIKGRFPISIFYGLTTLILTYTVCFPPRHGKSHPTQESLRQREFRFGVLRVRDTQLRSGYRPAHVLRITT
ncbi:MAG: hypothetical protein CM1200mP36_07910 [Gammaproteobacteria bacterium]|nr:MAG: hypothetical protein CM1200mP36_07910 [Gammaproteobacteria bacterium]